MRIKIEKYANIANVYLEFSNQMNILIGDNGTGKTLLLEAYSKINDSVISHFGSNNNFISSIIDRSNLNIKKVSKDGDNNFRFQLSLANSSEVKEQFEEAIQELKYDIEKRVRTDVLFEQLSMEGLLIEFGNIEELVNFSEEITVSISSFSSDSANDFINIENSEDYYLEFKSKDIGHVRFLNKSSLKKIIKSLNTDPVEDLLESFKFMISKIIEEKFLINNNIFNITYIPSERVYSMSKNLEKILSETSFLRYSEQKFMKDYEEAKESKRFMAKFWEENDYTSDEFKKLIGGTLNFDDGEVISLTDNLGVEIPRELFSIKQNKLQSLHILEQYQRFPRKSMQYVSRQLLIIEEPEAHLSIKSILGMFKYLKHLSKRYRIVIATHSDIMLTLVNNWYLASPSNNTVGGWELLDLKSENNSKYMFTKLELGDYGLISEFMNEQLLLLQRMTLKSQQNLNYLEE
ncbi:recombination protein F [Streptococcus pneumoniae]|uniref:Recombination protein F n=1 Tax=Streptococcus pneumoniae TaxID=1313 RepID=A0AA87CB82_STREE|nr:recombination protein F [Streptococcus pneumoniae]CIS63245.1 recombination protein F [Streptococcus pneumoniae]CIZ06992.1 recombination protein F [Streptococcus pneumoniae]CJV47406.1 recombination protein F [Streptococcus pneumoniae]CJW78339.1 recombination protein F [Streptococcus pneumoniae]